MNITMLIPKLEPSDNGIIVGGSANSLIRLVRGLYGKDFKTTIITSTPTKKKAFFRDSEFDFADYYIFANNKKPQSVTFGLVFLWKALIRAFLLKFKAKTDIVHGHSGYGVYALATYLVGSILGCTKVHTLYCPLVKDGSVDNKAMWILKGRLSSFALKKMDLVFAMSNNIAFSLREAGIPREKIAIMPTAIDTKKYNPDNDGLKVRRDLNLSPATPVILYVGNLMKSKGLHILLEAFNGVLAKLPVCRLVITLELKHAGFEEGHREFSSIINDLGLRKHIIQLGIIDYMPSLIAASDIIVAPYLDTQGPSDYPLAVMEAMASGRCVIGTEVGGMPELIENNANGILVPPANPSALEAAIVDLLSSRDRESMGRSARETILERYSVDKAVREHLKAYGEIL